MPLDDRPLRITRWSNWACAGGEPLGAVRQYDACIIGEELDGGDPYELTVSGDIGTEIVTGEVHRVVDGAGVVREFRIVGRQTIEEATAPSRVRLQGEPPLLDLADVGPILDREGPVPVLSFGAELTTTQWVEFVLEELVLRGQAYWQVGTIDDNAWTYLLSPATGWTPLELLRALQQERGLELRVTRVGDTALAIHLVREWGAGATRPLIRWGRNLRSRVLEDDVGERATAVIVQGAVPSGATRPADLGEAVWVLTGIVGTTPAWLQLADVSGQEGPIAFDGQLVDVGVHVLQDSGTTTALLGSRVSDQAVQVASGAGFTVGERLQFVADAAAKRLIELTAPNVRRMARTVRVGTERGERNLVRNAAFSFWSTPSTPEGGWTAIGGCQVARFKRPELYDNQAFTAMTSFAVGATSITLNTVPGQRVYGSEVLRSLIGSPVLTAFVGGTVHESDGAGDIVLPLRTPLGTAIAAGRILQLTNITQATPADPIRPYWETLPDEPRVPFVDGFALRFTTPMSTNAWPPPVGQDQLRSPSVRVHCFGGTQQVNASVGFTSTNQFTVPRGNLNASGVVTDDPAAIGASGRRHPALLLLNTTATPTLLAHGVMASIMPANKSIVHETVEIAATVSGDPLVAIALVPGDTNFHFAMARWVNLWLGLASGVPPYDGAWGTLLWQRANRELLARAYDGRNLEVTFADLSRAAGFAVSTEALTLGGRLDLGDAGVYPRIVALRLDLVSPDNSRVVLDGRSTRMTRLLAERL